MLGHACAVMADSGDTSGAWNVVPLGRLFMGDWNDGLSGAELKRAHDTGALHGVLAADIGMTSNDFNPAAASAMGVWEEVLFAPPLDT